MLAVHGKVWPSMMRTTRTIPSLCLGGLLLAAPAAYAEPRDIYLSANFCSGGYCGPEYPLADPATIDWQGRTVRFARRLMQFESISFFPAEVGSNVQLAAAPERYEVRADGRALTIGLLREGTYLPVGQGPVVRRAFEYSYVLTFDADGNCLSFAQGQRARVDDAPWPAFEPSTRTSCKGRVDPFR